MTMTMLVFWVILISSVLLQAPNFGSSLQCEYECNPAKCSPSGPEVRFPFWLQGQQSACCGFPGFNLSCNAQHDTIFRFQFPLSASSSGNIIPLNATANVTEIDYRNQRIMVSVTNGSCLPDRAPTSNSSASPFQLEPRYSSSSSSGSTLFNCSGRSNSESGYDRRIACLDRLPFQVYAMDSYSSLSDVSSLSSCVKMFDISDISAISDDVWDNSSRDPYRSINSLSWTNPDCKKCESKGKYCKLKNQTISNQTQCFKPKRKDQRQHNKAMLVKKVAISVVVVGVSVMTLVLGVLFSIYRTKKKERDNERKIVQFLEDYRALRPTRYSYSDIKRITEGFKHKLGRGGYGTVFKGMLANEIPVAVKILNNVKGNGAEFINEVGTIGNIHHVNVVRLVGYCADGYRRALVYEYLENDSLEKYITWGTQRSKLGWEKLFEISVGIAKGIEYLHQGCNQRILHFDIKPHNILLDQNLHPKVADFGLAKLCSKDKSVITMTAARGTIGYIAPEVFSRNFGRVSYKSDIYSFGMVLLDLVGGRKNFSANMQDDSQVYFPEWMYAQLEKGDDIEFQVESESDIRIVKRMITIGLWCIQWYPVDRPSMKIVIQMLESEDMPIVPPNPFAATDAADTFADSNGTSLTSADC